MFITLIRAVIIYILIIGAVRLMGKRQIGELQPSELVITILISEIAAIPLQDNGLPLINTVVSVFLLVALEIISSFLNMKSGKFRGFMQGHSLILIRDGKIDQKILKQLRFTMDDLLEALRQKDIFSIEDVEYAIVETNGNLSILLKPEKRTVTVDDVKLSAVDNGLPCTVISDGRVIHQMFSECNMTDEKLEKIVNQNNLTVENILLMNVDKNGNTTIIPKENDK